MNYSKFYLNIINININYINTKINYNHPCY